MNLRPIASNMTELELNGGITVLFSYKTPVAACLPGKGWYRTEKRWSVTTSKHIGKWLDGVKAEEKPQSFFDNLTA